jgi:hypothetical protein
MLKAAGPLARATAGLARPATIRSVAASAATAALRQIDPGAARRSDRHPIIPAAVRIERAVSRREGERSEQTAITVWFGQGPSLPIPGGATARGAMRITGGVIGAAALAAMTAIAARREEARSRVIDAPAPAVPVP